MEESVLDKLILMPDATLHDAFLEVHQSDGGNRDEPEIRLVRKLFTDALEIFLELVVSQAKPQLLKESRDWIFDEGNDDWIFSFENVCIMLDYEPTYWRRLCREYESRFPEACTAKRMRGRPAKNKAISDEHGD
jgi:hypothetical protein